MKKRFGLKQFLSTLKTKPDRKMVQYSFSVLEGVGVKVTVPEDTKKEIDRTQETKADIAQTVIKAEERLDNIEPKTDKAINETCKRADTVVEVIEKAAKKRCKKEDDTYGKKFKKHKAALYKAYAKHETAINKALTMKEVIQWNIKQQTKNQISKVQKRTSTEIDLLLQDMKKEIAGVKKSIALAKDLDKELESMLKKLQEIDKIVAR